MRVLPLLASKHNLSAWSKDAPSHLEAVIRAVQTTICVCTVRDTPAAVAAAGAAAIAHNAAKRAAAAAAARPTAYAAAYAAYAAYCDVASDESIFAEDTDAADDADSAAYAAALNAAVVRTAVDVYFDAAAAAAARLDFNALQHTKVGVGIPMEFFKEPVWRNSEPERWSESIMGLSAACHELGLGDLGEQFERWTVGEFEPEQMTEDT